MSIKDRIKFILKELTDYVVTSDLHLSLVRELTEIVLNLRKEATMPKVRTVETVVYKDDPKRLATIQQQTRDIERLQSLLHQERAQFARVFEYIGSETCTILCHESRKLFFLHTKPPRCIVPFGDDHTVMNILERQEHPMTMDRMNGIIQDLAGKALGATEWIDTPTPETVSALFSSIEIATAELVMRTIQAEAESVANN